MYIKYAIEVKWPLLKIVCTFIYTCGDLKITFKLETDCCHWVFTSLFIHTCVCKQYRHRNQYCMVTWSLTP